MSNETIEPRPVHALYCKCGILFHMATLGHALTDAAWQREVRKCLKAGGKAEAFDLNDKEATLYDGICECGYVTCCTKEAKASNCQLQEEWRKENEA
jgi:hypothetical protein